MGHLESDLYHDRTQDLQRCEGHPAAGCPHQEHRQSRMLCKNSSPAFSTLDLLFQAHLDGHRLSSLLCGTIHIQYDSILYTFSFQCIFSRLMPAKFDSFSLHAFHLQVQSPHQCLHCIPYLPITPYSITLRTAERKIHSNAHLMLINTFPQSGYIARCTVEQLPEPDGG